MRISNSKQTGMPLHRPQLIKILLIGMLLVSLILILKVVTYNYYPDFSSYYYSALALLRGENPYIRAEEAFGPFLYPPSGLLLFLPFTLFSYASAEKIFTVISLLSLFASLVLLSKLFRISLTSKKGLFLLILALNFFPAKFTLGMGQINNIVLLTVVLFIFFYLRKRWYLAGIFLAIAIAIKISPVLLFFYVIIEKQWNVMRPTLITLLIISLVVYLVVDQTVILYFFKTVFPDLLNAWPADYYNQSLSGFLMRGFGNQSLRNILKVVVTVLFTAGAYLLIWKSKTGSRESSLLSISILITLSLIISGISWQHHFVWFLIPLFLTCIHIMKSHLGKEYYFILGISYFLVALNIKNPTNFPTIFQSHVFYGALLLYGFDIYLLAFKSRKSFSTIEGIAR